jgi:serine/threonine protein kinase
LTDFGLSTFVDQETASSSTHAGSLRWMAPELIYPEKFGLDKFTRTPASDMYSFGCVCLEVGLGPDIC